MNRDTRDLEQIECSYRELDYPTSTSEAALYSPEDSEYGDVANCRATLHRPVVESTSEPEGPEYGDAAHCRTTLHRPLVSPENEAAENTVRASQIGISGAAPLVKEAAENAVEASWIVGAAKVPETLGAVQVMHS